MLINLVISGGTCHYIHQCAEANNKYMNDYHLENTSSSSISQKLSVDGFEWA